MRTGVRPDAGSGPAKGKVPQFVLRILLEKSYCLMAAHVRRTLALIRWRYGSLDP